MPLSTGIFGGEEFEWIRPSDFLSYIIKHDHLHLILGHRTLAEARPSLHLFWSLYEKIAPNHQVFERARQGLLTLDQTIPIYLHADEGRTLKKRAVFIMQWQPVCGKGCGHKNSDEYIAARLQELRLQPNFKGHSLTTRFLAGLLLASSYGENPAVLTDLIEHVCIDIASLGSTGIQVPTGETLYLATLGNKGDWSYLVTSAGLTRSYRNAPKRGASQRPDKPICHLCMAGARAYPYEDVKLGLRL